MTKAARNTPGSHAPCAPGSHRHVHGDQTCARCGTTDATVASTITRSGERWAPLCAYCSSKVARMSALASVA